MKAGLLFHRQFHLRHRQAIPRRSRSATATISSPWMRWLAGEGRPQRDRPGGDPRYQRREGRQHRRIAVLGIPPLKGTRLIVRRDANGAIESRRGRAAGWRHSGVKSATATIRIAKNPDTGEWVVSGGGSAEIGVGGFSGVLVIDVNGPFVTIAGKNLSLQRGPLKGSGYFQVTNRPLDPTGNPIEGGEPGDMSVSGHVEASMPLGSYLTATLGGHVPADRRAGLHRRCQPPADGQSVRAQVIRPRAVPPAAARHPDLRHLRARPAHRHFRHDRRFALVHRGDRAGAAPRRRAHRRFQSRPSGEHDGCGPCRILRARR